MRIFLLMKLKNSENTYYTDNLPNSRLAPNSCQNAWRERNRSVFFFKQTALVVLSLMILMLATACSSGKSSSGPKSMPTPEANVSPIPTVGPTITADPSAMNGNGTTSDGSDDAESTSGDGGANASEADASGLESDMASPNASKVVVLDPGHGGKFTGAIYFGHNEKNLTLQVANCVRDYLLENYENIEVYLTRESDIALDPDIKIELEQRAVIAKEHDADFFVSLHFNASEEHNLHGATVYASFRDNVGEASQGIAQSVLDQLVILGLKNNGVKTRKSQDYYAEDGTRLDYYAVIRHNALRDIPGIIIEHCFMDNDTDYAFIDTDEKIKALAEADAKGIANYLELKAKS